MGHSESLERLQISAKNQEVNEATDARLTKLERDPELLRAVGTFADGYERTNDIFDALEK